MGSYRVNLDWSANMRKAVEAYKGLERTPIGPLITSYNPSAKWFVEYLAKEGIPTKTTQLGAGVKRICVAEDVCEHCNGTGIKK